ncbi:MAG: NUDIX domain-containing protein [Acholeplasmatales bacterium]|nr:MAG: NUDIX domain-containing protein [Acholeplasmatales bacterium]
MKLIVCEDNLVPDDVAHLTPRIGVRAVLKHADQFVIIYHQAWDLYTLPGGGVEPGESLEGALHREMMEETGYLVRVIRKTLTLTEYYRDSVWEHHIYLCETAGAHHPLNLTKEEIAAGHEVQYLSSAEVLALFTGHSSPKENAANIYHREFLGFIHSVEDYQ